MLKSIIKKFLCSHRNLILMDVEGNGMNTKYTYKCIDCGNITVNNIRVKTK